MAKGYKRRYYRGNRDKYSVEQSAGTMTIPAGQQLITTIVPDTGIGGMRKVKHLTVSCAAQEGTAGEGVVFWALVYKPQGTDVHNMNLSGGNLYEPNQFVMNCGAMDFSAGPCRVTSPVSRNLNSGDNVTLIIANPTSGELSIRYVVRYAITLQ